MNFASESSAGVIEAFAVMVRERESWSMENFGSGIWVSTAAA
jgi:hypothetical protein